MRPTTLRALDNRVRTRRNLKPDFDVFAVDAAGAELRREQLSEALSTPGSGTKPLVAAAFLGRRLLRNALRGHVNANL